MDDAQRRAIVESTKGQSFSEKFARYLRHVEGDETPFDAFEQTLSDRLSEPFADLPMYHGGRSGRGIGDILKPSGKTGLARIAGKRLRTHVYFTPKAVIAKCYAADFADGALYRVKPIGPVIMDRPFLRLNALIIWDPEIDCAAIRRKKIPLPLSVQFCAPSAVVEEVFSLEL